MVVGQPHNLQPRHLALALKPLELSDEAIRPVEVGILHVEAAKVGIEAALERGRLGGARLVRIRGVGHPLAIAANAHACGDGPVPDVATGGSRGDKGAFAGIGKLLAVAVAERPLLLDKVGSKGPHAPLMAVGADLTLHIEVVEQDKLAGQGVVIGGDLLRKQTERRVAAALRHVAEDLVVGAILLDDVDHMRDRACVAFGSGNRMAFQAGQGLLGRRLGDASIRFGCPGCHLFFESSVVGRQIDEAHGAVEEAADVVGRGGSTDSRLGAVAVGVGDDAFAVGHEQPPAIRREPHARGIPANRDEAHALGGSGGGDVKHGQRVDGGIGHEQAAI